MRYLLATALLCAWAVPAAAQEPPKVTGTGGQKQQTGGTTGQTGGTAGQTGAKPADQQKPGQKPGEKPGTADKPATTEPKPAEDVEKLDIPASADPADIRAMRAANQMLEAEARLRRLLKEGKIKDIDQILTFEEIESWPYEDGLKGMPTSVKKLDGKKVMMTGFMLPIDEVENIKEFLLVQSLWSCCYGQPPDINGIVRVVMKGDKRVDYQFEPIKVVGEFKVEAYVEDGYCVDIYQLHTDDVSVIE